MNKQEFINTLKQKLSKYNQTEVNNTIEYYSELIDDMVEDGKSEEEAVHSLGSINDIINNAKLTQPLAKIVKERADTGNVLLNVILLILGFPIWFPLLVAFASIIFTLYVVIWSLVIVIFSLVFSFGIGAISSLVLFITSLVSGNLHITIASIACSITLTGLTILSWLCGVYAAKGLIILSKKIWIGIKKIFIKRSKPNE